VNGPEVAREGPSGGTTFTGKAKIPNQEQTDDLEYQLDAAEEELDMAQKHLAYKVARKAELKKKETKFQKKYLKDPSNKKVCGIRSAAGITTSLKN
jgi:hypothetical protein